MSTRGTEFGIQINGCGKDIEQTFAVLRELNITWVKQQVRWADIERSPGVYDWACIDAVVAAAQADGFKVLLSVTSAPPFRRIELTRLGQHPSAGRPDRLEDFGEFIGVLMARFHGRVHALELWNEPNLIIEWGDTLDAINYVKLLSVGYAAAKQADPFVMVISAGIAPSGFNSLWTHVDDAVFFKTALDVGLAHSADCIGAHANGPDGVGDIDAVAMRYAALAGNALPVCVTEFGYGLPVAGRAPPGFEWIMSHTEEAQVEMLGTGMAWATRSGFVRLVILWNLNYDGDRDPLDPNAPYALLRDRWRSGALEVLPGQ